MGYLIKSDFERVAQAVHIQQLISGNETIRYSAELVALTEIKSYLSAKYDVDSEFTNTQLYNPQATYSAADRVYLDAGFYSEQSTYILGQLSLKNGHVYQCTTAIPAPEGFTVGHWTLLGDQYDIFYVNYPYPVFDLLKLYDKGDQVFWKNHTYTCLIATPEIDHLTIIQYPSTNSIPYQNVFPNDVKNGSKYWQDGGVFVVPAGNLLTTTPTESITLFQAREDLFLVAGVTINMVPGNNSYVAPVQGQPGSLVGWKYSIERIDQGTLEEGVDYTKNTNGFTFLQPGVVFQPNERFAIHFIPITDQPVPVSTTGLSASQIIMTYFTKGDNRNQQLLMYVLDFAIYTMYRRIPPGVVPEIRILAYQTLKNWLNNVAKGNEINADITKLQPPQGSRIRSGSRPKQENYY